MAWPHVPHAKWQSRWCPFRSFRPFRPRVHGWPHAKSLSREALMLLLASARKKLNKMIICHAVDASLTFIFRPFRPRVHGWPHAKSLSRGALMLLLASARKKLNKMIICHTVDASLSHKPYLFYFPFFLCVHVFFVFFAKAVPRFGTPTP